MDNTDENQILPSNNETINDHNNDSEPVIDTEENQVPVFAQSNNEPTKYQTYAQIANASYDYYVNPSEVIEAPIDGYTVLREMSDEDSIVFINLNRKEIVLSIRGTVVSNIKDLHADAHIIFNTLESTDRFKSILQKAKAIDKYKGQFKFSLTGHSLGGMLAISVGRKLIDDIYGIWAFNAGFSVGQAIDAHVRNLKAKLGINNSAVRADKTLRTKLHLYTTAKDPISILSRAYDHHKIKAKTNIHSLDNFIGGRLLFSMIKNN